MSNVRRGFTLIEVIASCSIVAIILLATQSAIVLLVKTVPDGKTGPSARLAAARAVNMIGDDLRWATSITKNTASEIIFTVPDRDGGGASETIRYVWSGIPGGSLYRQYNGGGSVSISSNVQNFALTYDTGTIAASGGSTTSAETLLCSCTNGGLLAPTNDNSITSTNGVAEYFIPLLPANATSWNLTRMQMYMMGNTSPNEVIATIFSTSCGLPVSSVTTYQTPTMGGSYSWIALPITASGLDPHSGFCLEILGLNSKTTGVVQSVSTTGLLASSVSGYMLQTNNGGLTWTQPPNQSLLFYMYGSYVTPNANVSQAVLSGVRCTLQPGTDAAAKVVTTIAVQNAQVLP